MCVHDVIFSQRFCCGFFFQAEDGIRDLVRSRGLGDVYKRQIQRYVLPFSRHHVAHRLARAEWNEPVEDRSGFGLSLIHI